MDVNNDKYGIRLYGDPVLRQTARNVTEFTDSLRAVAEGMVEALKEENGLGLAAPQVGISDRVVVIDRSTEEHPDDFWVLVNPELVALEGECVIEEGCLSVPNIWEDVARPELVRVRYQDLAGEVRETDLEGMLARVVQHETDHLNGILFIDRLSAVKRQLLARALKTLAEKGTNG